MPPAAVPVRAPEPLQVTAPALDISAAVRAATGALPFKAPVPEAPGSGSAKTMPVRIMPSRTGETMPNDGGAIQQAIAALPFAENTGAPSVLEVPVLTVKQYVSLRMDLASRPDQAKKTLGRYGVPNEASRRVLDDQWQRALAASPALRAEADAAVATYTSWLWGQGR